MKLSIFTVAGLASLGLAAPAQLDRRETAVEATDRLLFKSSMSTFIAARNAKNPSSLDWSSDGCSSSPDNPFGFDFINSCYRHDFGYRNYKKQSRFTSANKAKIDSNFRSDMYAQCENEGNAFEVAACKGVADVYYNAVKEFGTKRAAEFEAKMRRDAEVEEIEGVEAGVVV
ncbi:uncharacterized protein EI97DRAFT_459370 [Westerdykella ornata]|uniref:Secretory phospholipase A2 n=1 Tax=Westerdykella ornata TaxID=318751 RepID=A0A6A6JIJ6_WESOR|nr:uncharacterized protein EI97DRAFT_459370 [Westerdykella ornata]KAF2275466.1 hypothetical protein EI97DRAFT_459370 [Westerdykella ornata]